MWGIFHGYTKKFQFLRTIIKFLMNKYFLRIYKLSNKIVEGSWNIRRKSHCLWLKLEYPNAEFSGLGQNFPAFFRVFVPSEKPWHKRYVLKVFLTTLLNSNIKNDTVYRRKNNSKQVPHWSRKFLKYPAVKRNFHLNASFLFLYLKCTFPPQQRQIKRNSTLQST